MTTDRHLSVVKDKKTGLYHGAVYRNHPTPSGCTRYILDFTTKAGYGNEIKAAKVINACFPDLPPLDISNLKDEDDDISQLDIPKGSLIIQVVPNKKEVENDKTNYEVRLPGTPAYGPPSFLITKSQFNLLLGLKIVELVGLKIIELESSSGYNPDLYYQYNTYRKVK